MLKRLVFLLLTLAVLLLPTASFGQTAIPILTKSSDGCFQYSCGFEPHLKSLGQISSKFIQRSATTWYVGAEAVLAPEFNYYFISPMTKGTYAPTKLPDNGTLRLQATVRLVNSPGCAVAALAYFENVNDPDDRMFPIIISTDGKTAAQPMFINYVIPEKYSDGNIRLHLETVNQCFDPLHPASWEIQGTLEVTPSAQ
jgi:hypothetical protein